MIDHAVDFEPDNDEFTEARKRLEEKTRQDHSLPQAVAVGYCTIGTMVPYAMVLEYGGRRSNRGRPG